MKIIIKCTDGIMTGKEWRFNGSGQITLGREKGSMVTTAPEDNSISRHQCVIDVVPPNVYVSDAGSTHGTYVNGQLIGKKGQGGQCPVRDGAFIGVGSGGRTAVFQIRIIEEERGTVSPDYIADNMDNHYKFQWTESWERFCFFFSVCRSKNQGYIYSSSTYCDRIWQDE